MKFINICADASCHNELIEMEPTALTEIAFRKPLWTVTLGMEFSFSGVMYRQIDWVTMGSPLGPALADIIIELYDRKMPEDDWPELYSSCVDDVFSHFTNKGASVEFCELLNSLRSALCFTCDGEHEGSLPFLNVKVTRTVDGIESSIYRKPTFTGLYMPWDSYNPTRCKINLV